MISEYHGDYDHEYIREWVDNNLNEEELFYFELGVGARGDENIRDFFQKKIEVKELIRVINKMVAAPRFREEEWADSMTHHLETLLEMDRVYEFIPDGNKLEAIKDDVFDAEGMEGDGWDDTISSLLEVMMESDEYEDVRSRAEEEECDVDERSENDYNEMLEERVEGVLERLRYHDCTDTSMYERLLEKQEGNGWDDFDEINNLITGTYQFIEKIEYLDKIEETLPWDDDDTKRQEHEQFVELFKTLHTSEYVESGVGQENILSMYVDYIDKNDPARNLNAA